MKKFFSLVIAMLPTMVFAHGGHSIWEPDTFIHYLGTPEHALPVLAIGLVGAFFFRRHLKSTTRQP